MSGMCTTGEWVPKDGDEDAFVEAWNEFATWAGSKPGAGPLRPARDRDGSRFVSFGLWDDIESAHQWKSDPEFSTRMAQLQQHVASFRPSELDIVRVVGEES